MPPTLLTLWALGALLILGMRVAVLRRIAENETDPLRSRRGFRLVQVLISGSSLTWAFGIPMFAYYGSGLELTVLALVGTSMFVGVLLMNRAIPVAALFHTTMLAAGLLVAAWLIARWDAWPVLLLILVYAAVLMRSVLAHDRAFVRTAIAELERTESEATVRMLLSEYEVQASDWLWTVGPKGNLREVSDRLAQAFGRPAAELEGQPFIDQIGNGERRDLLADALAQRQAFRDKLVRIELDGEIRFWRLSARPRIDGRMTGVARDVTDTQIIEERVSYMAHFDSLTGLANRYMFNERLRDALAQHGSNSTRVALFYLDLDDFKGINDTQGHMFGDRLLREVGARLEQDVRCEDLVARLGGDEFAVIVVTNSGDGMLIERAHRFLAILREPFEIDGQTVISTASVGVARCSKKPCEADELMRRADLALHAAKAKGRDQVALFDRGLDREMQERRRIEHELREAIKNDELRVHYQPVIDLDNGATVAYEALVRWEHPQRGMLAPLQFLTVAENTGLIIPLGDWVIRRALNEMAKWDGDFRVAINLSPSQIRSAHLLNSVTDALAESGMDPCRVEFEITEHVILEHNDVALATLMKLREMGMSIALDDFGTGYSSLSYLRRFPLDRIKIDREFVKGLGDSVSARAIVSAITRLADAMGIPTTAEGVELPDQLDLLRKLGCNEAQGYLIQEPVAAIRLGDPLDEANRMPELYGSVLDYRKARQTALARRRKRSA
ncbi:hypothetical protein A9995_04005 [Erythrobacter sp. QSSC1-22B]|uniref:putative bifunctional diguanylate cyclase/phosphodiesterase n=1 Tax=Erythrobacter sp. QSSC1-22B TaxID=1860125 RepID=UPI000804AB27|nr:EAL domain-containing protein [Erythrobacter sp. QSSC1-22B]OBX19735.1 hypothetical protein A9995_04005 [Erythrobacter sp. QSSC1-22B]